MLESEADAELVAGLLFCIELIGQEGLNPFNIFNLLSDSIPVDQYLKLVGKIKQEGKMVLSFPEAVTAVSVRIYHIDNRYNGNIYHIH